MKNCCSDFNNAISYIKPVITQAGKLWLFNVGENNIPYKKALNLAKLVSSKKQLEQMPKHKLDKIISIPVLWPMNFCPFCGKKIGKNLIGGTGRIIA